MWKTFIMIFAIPVTWDFLGEIDRKILDQTPARFAEDRFECGVVKAELLEIGEVKYHDPVWMHLFDGDSVSVTAASRLIISCGSISSRPMAEAPG